MKRDIGLHPSKLACITGSSIQRSY